MVRMQRVPGSGASLRLGATRTGQSDTAAVRGPVFFTGFLIVRTPIGLIREGFQGF